MTSTVSIPKQPLTDTLDQLWSSFAELLAELSPAEWAIPSGLPGWTVHDVVAHVLGTESMLSGEQTPEADIDVAELPHVHNDMGVANERWVRALRELSPEQMRGRFNEVIAARRAALAAMSQEDFDAPSWTPAGPGTYASLMRIRVFDSWMHEQDIRFAVGRPGHEGGDCAELAFDQIERGLGFVIGKKAAAPQGATVTLSLTGPVRRDVHVRVDERAAVVDTLPGPATSVLTLPSPLAARLVGGRTEPADHLAEIELAGDRELGERIIRNLAFTM
ncbi:maleylpyruvate isomerase family mycothiol-dependent enzyme [Amycolatopsis aidingensis]|uniref:maleylpyruvate isomerase family mycothiol-dependent enzyme n=1 Tax=Amycolatopsis aidingensis TaxID=2842453 RepID=UPI001E483FE0|nr:maleylpyruvate isomerase family mycothiol-dependent enzyme [Amycolatopsis aidingensis]